MPLTFKYNSSSLILCVDIFWIFNGQAQCFACDEYLSKIIKGFRLKIYS
jgi:hypothetical protein